MAIKTIFSDVVAEKTSAKITAVLQDEDGAGIPSGSLSTLTLSLYLDGDITQIINSRNAQNVLNTNGVTVDTSGNLTWQMDPADNPILGSGSTEDHVALFEWTWGTKAGKHEIVIRVQDLAKVS